VTRLTRELDGQPHRTDVRLQIPQPPDERDAFKAGANDAGPSMPPRRERREKQERLGGRARRIKHVEGGVAQVGQLRRDVRGLDEGEGVVRVADHFGDGPGEDHGCVEDA
jgi:hypothetical protein